MRLIPHFIGAGAPHWNPHARGIIFGLALGHKSADLYRAILEGVAMEIKKSLNVFQSLGMRPSEMRVTGGGSRSNLWNQIMADVLGIPCGRGELEESTAVGASILASYGAGEFNDLVKAAENMANISKRWTPNPSNTDKYAKLFEISEKLYDKINCAGLYDELAKFTI